MFKLHTSTSSIQHSITTPGALAVSILIFLMSFFALSVMYTDARSHGANGGRGGPSGGSTSGSSVGSGGSSGPGAAAVSSATDGLGGSSLGDVASTGGNGGGSSLGSQVDQVSADATGASTLGEVSAAISSGDGSLSGFQSQETAQAVADAMNDNNPGTGSVASVNSNGGLAGSHGVGMSSVGNGGNGGDGGSFSFDSSGDSSSNGSAAGSSDSDEEEDPPVDGSCGSADGSTSLTSAPSGSSACSDGSRSLNQDSLSDGWSWVCQGENGGSDASCSAIGVCSNVVSHTYEPVPTASLNASFVDNDPWGESVTEAAPADRVELSWTEGWENPNSTVESNTDRTCGPTGFNQNGEEITPGHEMGLGDSRTYSVSCSESLCGNTGEDTTATVGIPQPTIDQFSPAEDIIRAGDSTELEWSINVLGRTPYPMNCSITGATSVSFAAESRPNDTTGTGPVDNYFENRLRCTEPVTGEHIQQQTDIEVVPAVQER